jgi:hypothetical protein
MVRTHGGVALGIAGCTLLASRPLPFVLVPFMLAGVRCVVSRNTSVGLATECMCRVRGD